jgi:hypothetical protein
MSVVVIGVCLFLLAFAAHVVWWRHGRPRRSGQTLIYLLVAVIVLGWLAAILAAWISDFASLLGDAFALLQALLLALALAAAYVMTYPALEVESPILVIIEEIAQRGPKGVEADEFHRRLGDSVLVTPRLQDLVDEGLVVRKGDRYTPTAKGISLARVFIGWRKILGAGIGG